MSRPTSMRFAVSLLWLALAMLVLVACSSGPPAEKTAPVSSAEAPNPGTSDAKFHSLLITGLKYRPDTLTVNQGDTIEWANNDMVPHTATAKDKSFDSGKIAPGASWKFVAKTKGSYAYLCTLHPNMKAKLVVQ